MKAGAGSTVSCTVTVLATPPPVPVIVIVDVPSAALPPTLSVITLPVPAATVVLLNDACTPLGMPDAESEIGEVNGPVTAVIITDCPEPPRGTERAEGDAVRARVTGAVTVMFRAVVLVIPPPVAVIVTEETPAFAVGPAVNATMLLATADPVILRLAGEKEAVTPAGRPEAIKETVEVKPVPGLIDTGTPVFPPGIRLTDAAEEVSEKEGLGIVTVNAAVFVSPPPLAVIVTE